MVRCKRFTAHRKRFMVHCKRLMVHRKRLTVASPGVTLPKKVVETGSIPRHILAGSNGSASVSFERFGNQRAADRYAFNPQDGEITEVTLYKDTDASGKMRGWIYSVHVGSWGGMFTRILTFIAALLGGTLPLTGYYLWLRRIRLI